MQYKKVESDRAQISGKSDKVMYDRFDLDFQNVAQDLGLGDGYEADQDIKITLGKMSQLFLSLGFIKPDSNEQDQAQLATIWKIVGGDREGQEEVFL